MTNEMTTKEMTTRVKAVSGDMKVTLMYGEISGRDYTDICSCIDRLDAIVGSNAEAETDIEKLRRQEADNDL